MPILGLAGSGGGISSRFIGLLPGYIVSTSAASVNEGSSVTFTVTTANVPDATTLYWSLNTISGTVNTSDFNGAAVNGSFTITSGSGSVVLALTNDVTTEGTESFQLQVRTGSTSGIIVATSATVPIGDTSIVVPVISFYYTGNPIEGSMTIYWDVTNSSSVSIDQGVGAVASSGSRGISNGNIEILTYTLTAISSINGLPYTSSFGVQFGCDGRIWRGICLR